MGKVSVLGVNVISKIASFESNIEFEVTINCIEIIKDSLEWKVVYLGSAHTEEFDQVLEIFQVGPVPLGICKFKIDTAPPKIEKIPRDELIGITVILLIGSYLEQEFVRIGYYVENSLPENFEGEPKPNDITRKILDDSPRITKYAIGWNLNDAELHKELRRIKANQNANNENNKYIREKIEIGEEKSESINTTDDSEDDETEKEDSLSLIASNSEN